MSTLDLSTASLNDIVFEGRNKAYGAFILRQLYHRHLARALAIAVSLSLLLVSAPLVKEYFFPALIVSPDIIPDLPPPLKLMRPPVTEPIKELGGAAPAHAVVRPRADVAPTVVPDKNKPLERVIEPVAPTVGPIDDQPIIEGPLTSKTGTGTGTGPGNDSVGSGKAVVPASSTPFLVAEVMPQFVGGNEALMRYMQKNLRYPPQALRNSIEGRVFVSFTVQADGSIADVQVLKGLGFGTDEEAAKVVKNMPSWIPGQQNKRNVAVRYTIPITFQYE